jgi:hypothetical protein
LRDIYAVLREKQDVIRRLHREIEALRLVVPLLDGADTGQLLVSNPSAGTVAKRFGPRVQDALLATEANVTQEPVREEQTEAAVSSRTAKAIAVRLRHLLAPLWNVRRSLADFPS